jgi:Rps23 Pro-64 3,4-dihydroxylase Tpa1-like proline 4-hydroxylase
MDALLRNVEFMRELDRIPEELAASYAFAKPYPHIVMDDFLPPAVLERVLADFPAPGQVTWQKFDSDNEKKLAFRQAESLPTPIRELLYFFNSHPTLLFLERLTGINGLIPDPSFTGGGCHQIERGGKLQVHVDFNKLQPTNLDRRLNLLIYLNKDWREEYGGHFELWDAEGKGCVKKVLPIFNRCVVFSTTETSYHGHPHPLSCPENRTRKSIALYYYTNGREDGCQSAGDHSTVFLGDRENGGKKRSPAKLLKYLLPPVAVDIGKWVLGTQSKPFH